MSNNTPDIDSVAMQAGSEEPVLSPLISSAALVFNFWTSSRHAVLCSADSIKSKVSNRTFSLHVKKIFFIWHYASHGTTRTSNRMI